MGDNLDLSGLMGNMNRHGRNNQPSGNNRSNAGSKPSYSGGYNKGYNSGNRGYNGSNSGQKNRNTTGSQYGKKDEKALGVSAPGDYVGAPYNFVPINEKTFDYTEHKKECPAHNKIRKELYSGQIEYEIEAKTPILVGSGKKGAEEMDTGGFYRDVSGKFAIPGSAVRGLVRGNAQILSFSDIGDDIEDYLLMYRNIASGAEKNTYGNVLGNKALPVANGKNITILKNVKAGYIEKKNGRYFIYETQVKKISDSLEAMNYYVASERAILADYQKHREKSSFSFLFSKNFGKAMLYVPNTEFTKDMRGGKVHYVPKDKRMFNGRLGGPYRAYYRSVSYELSGERAVTAIGAPNAYKKQGYLLSSGAMNEKKAIYIIPEIDREKYICLNEKDIDAYKRDFEGKKTQLGDNAEFYKLPEEGDEIKPVFYIELGGRLYFGFTPRLRLFYDKTVKEGFHQNAAKLDYCKALFGTAKKGESYKSRVSFLNACADNADESSQISLILGSPKPTSYLDYIESKDNPETRAATYNDDFRLRGIKQYWLKKQADNGAGQVNAADKKSSSRLKPLKAGVVFKGKISFSNLSEDELGLLIWSLELDPESEQNIGKAKAYGYGRVKVKVEKLNLFDSDKAYDISVFSFDPHTEADKDVFVKTYTSTISDWLGKDIRENAAVKDFLLMKNGTLIPDASKTRYMSIDNKEYQKRVNAKVALPRIKDVIWGKKC